MIIIISDSVDDRDQKPRYGIEVLLNFSRYLPANISVYLYNILNSIDKLLVIYIYIYNIHSMC